ncbi:MAG: phosphotransferase [Oligoflexia bacterium]|nr:phosphotransferase [Oligoflexia bacterium]
MIMQSHSGSLEIFNTQKCFELIDQGQRIYQLTNQMLESFQLTTLHTHIKQVVDEYYNLGEVIGIHEIFGGYVNRSFAIFISNSERYFLRKYKTGITEKEIMFEHSLIDFALQNGFTYGAQVVASKSGATFIQSLGEYYAIYQFLPGEDKYTWDNPTLNDEECASAAEVLAIFHNATRNFNPGHLQRVEPKIMDFLPTRTDVFKGFAEMASDRNKRHCCQGKFHRYYINKLDSILDCIKINTIAPEVWKKMPLNPCHNDYHPGNLKFANNRVIAVFDFDWSKIDLRLFDLALAMNYCCSSWDEQQEEGQQERQQEGKQDGQLLLNKCHIFLKTYQATLKRIGGGQGGQGGGLTPLTDLEHHYLPTMMAAANLYLINWDVTAYYNGENLNDYEYLTYLRHNVRVMEWIEENKKQIKDLL